MLIGHFHLIDKNDVRIVIHMLLPRGWIKFLNYMSSKVFDEVLVV
jgi:hypothetical protein